MADENKPKKKFRLDGGIIAGLFVASCFAGMVYYTKIFVPAQIYTLPIVTLEGTVADERYVQRTENGSFFGNSKPSEYYFSVDTNKGRMSVEVMDKINGTVINYNNDVITVINNDINKESIDTKLYQGTKVIIKAREVTLGQYKAFADDIKVP